MCGLFGSVGLGDLPEAAILEALRGRGPDDRGRWQGGLALLLHTRLAIQDLSPLGHQPMLSDNGALALVFNGEIYNQQELRLALEAEGEQFRSRSDTEVLLRGFQRWKNDLWGRLNGIFAVASWDVEAQRLTLARDGFGVKPLLWKREIRGCAFGSELSAFEAAGLASRRHLSAEALESYALWGAVAAPLTLLSGVEVFPAGHWGQWSPGGTWTLHSFADPLPPLKAGPPADDIPAWSDPAAQVGITLLRAVERQAIGDVPVGLFLSGGLDSGLLCAQHGVASFGECGAGGDGDGRAGVEAGECFITCTEIRAGEQPGARSGDGVAIHRGGVEGRQVGECRDRRGKCASERGLESHGHRI